MDFSKYWEDGDTERNLPFEEWVRGRLGGWRSVLHTPFVGENLIQYISRVGGYTIEYTKPEPRWFDFFQNPSLKPSAVMIEDKIREELLSFDDIVNAAQH